MAEVHYDNDVHQHSLPWNAVCYNQSRAPGSWVCRCLVRAVQLLMSLHVKRSTSEVTAWLGGCFTLFVAGFSLRERSLATRWKRNEKETMQKERIPITQEGLRTLQEEYDELVNERRPAIVRAIAQAREEGDLRENAGYDAAKHDQGLIEARIREIEATLRRIEVIDKNGGSSDGSVVRVGSTVTIEIEGEEETYTIVGAVEAKPTAGRISNESPFGKAMLGRKPDAEVTIETPGAPLTGRIVRIEG